MGVLLFYTQRILIIIIAIFSGYALYNYLLRPHVLYPMCLVDSNGCAKMSYYSYNNSALIKMQNGLWIWYNGDKAFVYGQPVGQLCENPKKYEAAYVINTKSGMKEGYKCVLNLSEVLNFYNSNGVKEKHLVSRINNSGNFTVYDVLNLFSKLGLINI